MSALFAESSLEKAALAWLDAAGWPMARGEDIAAHIPAAEWRDDLAKWCFWRACDTRWRLNPELPPQALEDTFRRLARPEDQDLIQSGRFTACW